MLVQEMIERQKAFQIALKEKRITYSTLLKSLGGWIEAGLATDIEIEWIIKGIQV